MPTLVSLHLMPHVHGPASCVRYVDNEHRVTVERAVLAQALPDRLRQVRAGLGWAGGAAVGWCCCWCRLLVMFKSTS